MPSTTALQRLRPSIQALGISIPLGLCSGTVNILIFQHFLFALTGILFGEIFEKFLAVLLSGVIAGAMQGAFLRFYARPVALWLIASGIGWILAYALMQYFYTVNETHSILPTFGELSLGIGMGFLVSIAQWPVLQQRWTHAYLWIVSTVIVWGFAWVGMTYFFYAIMGPAL